MHFWHFVYYGTSCKETILITRNGEMLEFLVEASLKEREQFWTQREREREKKMLISSSRNKSIAG